MANGFASFVFWRDQAGAERDRWPLWLPVMLVGADAATVMLCGADGRLHFLARPTDRYAAQDWLTRDGDGRAWNMAVGMPGLACDGLVCMVQTRAGLLALSRRPESLEEDCKRAALLVSAAKVECKEPRFIADGPRAMQDEGYALWFMPELKIESVRDWRGKRPWVQ